MDACGKFGELEKCKRVARGAAESYSGFLRSRHLIYAQVCINKDFFCSSSIYGKHAHYVLVYYKDYYFLLLLEANVVFIIFNFFSFNYSVYLIKHGTTMIDCKVFNSIYATLYRKYYFHDKNCS